MAAAPGVDEAGAPGQCGKGAGAEDALRLGGQRQQADEDFSPGEEGRQARRTGIGLKARGALLPPAPAQNRKAQGCELAPGVAPDLAEAENPDRPLGGVLLPELAPDPGLLLGPVVEILAVHSQHLQDNVLAHRVDQIGIDQPDDRQGPRQQRIDEDVVDPGPERQDQLEVRQRGEEARLGPPHERVFYVGGVADFRPHADFEVGHQPADLRPPARRRIDRGTEQERHWPPS